MKPFYAKAVNTARAKLAALVTQDPETLTALLKKPKSYYDYDDSGNELVE